jgi:hypothetical protein
MRIIIAIAVATFTGGVSWAAAEQQKPPSVKMLAPAECALITKRSDDEFYVKGPITIGSVTLTDSSISRKGIIVNDVDNFDVINRSCFNGKPM